MSIKSEIKRIKDLVADAFAAVVEKGGSKGTGKLANLPAAIRAISIFTDTSDATAAAGDILSGKTAYVKGSKVSGSIATKTSNNLSASGKTVTVPAGYYASSATKDVGTATQATPSVSINSTTGLITASATQSAGYVSAGTKSGTLQLTTKGATTVTPTKATQNAVNSGVYTTGIVTVGAIPSNYVDTSSATAAATDIITGKTAYVNGSKITGTRTVPGLHWKSASKSTSIPYVLGAYAGGVFVSAAYNGMTSFSFDGVQWFSGQTLSSSNWRGIGCIDNRFVMISYDSSQVAYSDDGVSWNAVSLAYSGSPISRNANLSFAYGKGKLLNLPYSGSRIIYSADGLKWEHSSLAFTLASAAFAYGYGRFVILSGDGKGCYSDDGLSWNTITIPTKSYVRDLQYHDGAFIGLVYPSSSQTEPRDSGVVSSVDGINWSVTNFPYTLTTSGNIAYGDGKWVVLSQRNLSYYRTGSEGWVHTTAPFSITTSAPLLYGNGKFVYLTNSAVYYSEETP